MARKEIYLPGNLLPPLLREVDIEVGIVRMQTQHLEILNVKKSRHFFLLDWFGDSPVHFVKRVLSHLAVSLYFILE